MSSLAVHGRQLFDVPLVPVSGSRFQPTGFPDVGAATFKRPVRNGANGDVTWQEALLVESAQSMANHLEAVGWLADAQSPHPTLGGMPYVRVVANDDGRYLTSSRTEAHRLGSAFVKDAFLDGRSMREEIKERLDLRDDTPLAPRQIARAVFRLDPLCLIHGVFFAEKAGVFPGQPRIARAVTGFVEALDVQSAVSGGVKRDDVHHAHSESAGSKEGYGSIPFHRTEWTAAEIVASLNIDLDQINSYGLGEAATALLIAVARWEIASLFESGLRLRTACDLVPMDTAITDRSGNPLPSVSELSDEISSLVPQCSDLLGDGTPLEVVWDTKKARG